MYVCMYVCVYVCVCTACVCAFEPFICVEKKIFFCEQMVKGQSCKDCINCLEGTLELTSANEEQTNLEYFK